MATPRHREKPAGARARGVRAPRGLGGTGRRAERGGAQGCAGTRGGAQGCPGMPRGARGCAEARRDEQGRAEMRRDAQRCPGMRRDAWGSAGMRRDARGHTRSCRCCATKSLPRNTTASAQSARGHGSSDGMCSVLGNGQGLNSIFSKIRYTVQTPYFSLPGKLRKINILPQKSHTAE